MDTPSDLPYVIDEEGIPGALLWSSIRFMGWLVATSYIQEAEYRAQIVLFLAWFALFFWRYVFRKPSDVATRIILRDRRAHMGIALPKQRLPAILLLSVVVAVSVPWWVAAFTHGCSDPSSFESIWRNHLVVLSPVPLGPAVVLVVMRAAAYPLVEEFTFRGWILAALRRKIGDHIAVIVAAVLFALMHLSPDFLVRNFVLGVLFGYAAVFTSSIWAAFAMHFTFNFVSDVVPATSLYPALERVFRTPLFRCPASWLALLLSVIAIGSILLMSKRRRLVSAKGSDFETQTSSQ